MEFWSTFLKPIGIFTILNIESKLTIPFEKNWRNNIYITIGRYDYIFKQSTVIKWIDALERIKVKLLVSIHHYQLEGILSSTIVH